MPFKVGLMRFFYQDPIRSNWEETGPRPLVTDVWYPAVETAMEEAIFLGPPELPFFYTGKAAKGAEPLAQGSFPLILLSHGTGGLSLQLGWLATSLAAEGYIVAAVNHHGNNGLEPYIAKGFLHYWERAKDLTSVLNQLLQEKILSGRINQNQIGAAGFSLGGYTVIAVAGGMTNVQAFRDIYKFSGRDISEDIPPEFTDKTAFIEEFNSLDQYVAIADASHRDKRIKAAFAIAPVLGAAFSQTGLSSVDIPIKIVVGNADQLAPANSNAKYFAKYIKNAELTILEKVGHYTFLGEATEAGQRELPMLCLDEDGIDRAAIHKITSQLASEFFEAQLKV